MTVFSPVVSCACPVPPPARDGECLAGGVVVRGQNGRRARVRGPPGHLLVQPGASAPEQRPPCTTPALRASRHAQLCPSHARGASPAQPLALPPPCALPCSTGGGGRLEGASRRGGSRASEGRGGREAAQCAPDPPPPPSPPSPIPRLSPYKPGDRKISRARSRREASERFLRAIPHLPPRPLQSGGEAARRLGLSGGGRLSSSYGRRRMKSRAQTSRAGQTGKVGLEGSRWGLCGCFEGRRAAGLGGGRRFCSSQPPAPCYPRALRSPQARGPGCGRIFVHPIPSPSPPLDPRRRCCSELLQLAKPGLELGSADHPPECRVPLWPQAELRAARGPAGPSTTLGHALFDTAVSPRSVLAASGENSEARDRHCAKEEQS